MMSNKSARATRWIVVASFLFAHQALGYWDFRPTPLEWASWPEYCKVQYEWVNAGYFREYAGRFNEAQIESWRQRIGVEDFTNLHHYCASIHFLSRARAERTEAQKVFQLTNAYDNANYSFSRAVETGPLYAVMAAHLADILIEQGQKSDAMETLQASIRAQPDRVQPYLMLALAHRKEGDLKQARQVLEDAEARFGHESLELQYNLGLINIEAGDLDAAVENAKVVYAKDYPLDGLKNRLKRAGRWPPKQAIP